MICVVLLVGMYVATLIVALLDFPGWDRLFQACLVATIGLPILLWIYIWLYQQIRERGKRGESITHSTPSVRSSSLACSMLRKRIVWIPNAFAASRFFCMSSRKTHSSGFRL